MKVSILGNGLTSLTLAKSLTNQGVKVDIFQDKKIQKNNKTQICHDMAAHGSKIKIVEAPWTEISRRIRWNDRKLCPNRFWKGTEKSKIKIRKKIAQFSPSTVCLRFCVPSFCVFFLH